MTEFKIYPTIPSAPPPPQNNYHWHSIQSKKDELQKLKVKYETKRNKYDKILNRLVWLNASSSATSVASGISSVATLSTFIGLPVSVPLAAVSLTGAGISCITTTLTKKYQKKLSKVTKLIDIIISALSAFEIWVSKALNADDRIDAQEFNTIHTLYYKTLRELTTIDRKMEAEARLGLENGLLEKINDLERKLSVKPKDV